MNTEYLSYVLITPAHNEESLIEATIRSVTAQTHLPVEWIIVDDGSTDGTAEVVKKYMDEYPFISLVRRPHHTDRQFAAKVKAFNAGYEEIRTRDYDVIGNLDADLTFDDGYMLYLMTKFKEDIGLGVAGTPFVDEGNPKGYDFRYTNIEHVSGACQLFRRACFEEIGGYQPIRGGGIDWVAVTTARMKGWKTRTFTDKVLTHHRKMGSYDTRQLSIAFKLGKKDYSLGNHPLWQIFRCIYQGVRGRPLVISGVALYAGYISSFLTGSKRPISRELVEFTRKEQMKRLLSKFKLK